MDIRKLVSERFGGESFGINTGEYKFGKIKTAKEKAMAENPDLPIIDMGIGEPDGMADISIINELYLAAQKYENRVYPDNGGETFKKAAIEYLENVFNVKNINIKTEIVHGMGSKSILAFLPACFINEGDYILSTAPGYPVLQFHTQWFKGKVYNMPLLEENNFLPDFSIIPEEILQKAKLMYLNYPNNPTGAVATKDFFVKAIEIAKKYNIVVINDAAYSALQFEGEPLSFLSIEGAKDVGIEIFSMSKAFNMTGWRLAFVAGNSFVIDLFKYSKDNYDSGQFLAIQDACAFALKHPELTQPIKEKYLRRHKELYKILKSHGFNPIFPGGTFFMYVKAPKFTKEGIVFNSGEEFSQYLIKKLHLSTVPWDECGNYVRFSVTFELNGKSEDDIFTELDRRLKNEHFEF